MKCRLTIGVLRPDAGTRILLEMLGVACEPVARLGSIDPERFSALLINAPVGGRIAAISEYLGAGGAVLDTGHFLPATSALRFPTRHVRSFAPADDDVFGGHLRIDIGRNVRHHPNARHLGGTVFLGEAGGGHIAYVPFDPEHIFTDRAAHRAMFYSPCTRFPDEIVARASKGELRRVFETALVWLHAQRGLPYLHRWHLPGSGDGLLAYRIDSDYGTRQQIEKLHDVAARNGVPLTWFLHAAAHRGWLADFSRFDGDELGLHCYRHRTFPGIEDNVANMRHGLATLEEAGIVARSFAAPNGFWNEGLARAVEQFGFVYSSEFSFDYDNLPSRPWLRDRPSSALQVPVHPVCIGSLIRAKATPEAMMQYFRWIVDRKAALREPVFLYHHPGHEHWDVMDDSLRYARRLGLRPITLGEYARWWTRREAVRYEAWLDSERIVVRYSTADPEVRLAMRGPGTFALLPALASGVAEQRQGVGDVRWEPIGPVCSEAAEDVARTMRFSLRTLRHTVEDYNARARQ